MCAVHSPPYPITAELPPLQGNLGQFLMHLFLSQ